MRLLSEALPLRKTSDLSQYREDAWMPWIFGQVTLRPIPMDDKNLEHLVADHAVTGITRVTVGGKPTKGYQLIQRADETGHPVSLIRLTQSATEDVAVTVVGMRDATTGETIAHPADIATALLKVCGWDVLPDTFIGLKDDYPALSLGMVFDSPVTLRDALSSIIVPLGAIWTAKPLYARKAGTIEPRVTLTEMNTESISATSNLSTIATVARVSYAYDWAAQTHRNAMRLAAQSDYEMLEAEISLPAVRAARDALTIVTSRLADLARAQWTITANVHERVGEINVGDCVMLDHPLVPRGVATVIDRGYNREQASIDLTMTMHAGPMPIIEMTSRATAIDPYREDPVSISYRDGQATFTIMDEAGAPMANAAVTLDSDVTKNTDRNGVVQFKTPRGLHTILVYLAGYAPFEMDVMVQ